MAGFDSAIPRRLCIVIAGLDPPIHDSLIGVEVVHGRIKSGRDGTCYGQPWINVRA